MTTASTIAPGDMIPDMTLRDDQGAEVRLRDLAGRRVVLYFYPKDETSGCTAQACALRESWSTFEAMDDVVVYGVSPDPVESHEKFRSAHDLPFGLLVDEEHRLAGALGFWVEKTNYGRTYWGVERSSVVVGTDGRVMAMVRRVQPAKHVEWLEGALADA